MKCLRYVTLLLLLTSYGTVLAQSDYVKLGSRQYDLLTRLELKLRTDSVLNFSAVKPFERKTITDRLYYIQTLAAAGKIHLSKVDEYNLNIVLKDNFDWRPGMGDTTIPLKNLFTSSIRKNPAYIGVKRGDFSAYISPLLDVELGHDNNLNHPLFMNRRGFYLRGTLSKGIGYYSYFTTNQERDPLYVQQYAQKYQAVPGAGYYKNYQNDGFDYFDARGGIMFKAGKTIDFQFAYDKVFIGNGIRSLILSDGSNDMLFLKINTRFWKFQYYNLFAQLVSSYQRGPDYLRPQKYMTLHYLDFQATKWLNIGLFEDVMFGRSSGFDLNYLNPIIFYRSVEQQLGSPDKVTLGGNIKANVFKNTQLYSQIIINEFVMKEVLRYKNGYYANKQALQLGFKSIDVFGIKNLDVQGEVNLIRPFVYSHYDSAGSFTHYNQPLAHPLGANLREFLGVIKYQPINRLQLTAKAMYIEQGLDSAGYNFGANPFEFYTSNRISDYGFYIGSGLLAKTAMVSATITYELIPNLFFDVTGTIRKYKVVNQPDFTSNIIMLGMRWNLARRTFDF